MVTREIVFKEVRTPTLTMTRAGKDVPMEGSLFPFRHVEPSAAGFFPAVERDQPKRASSSDVALATNVMPAATCRFVT